MATLYSAQTVADSSETTSGKIRIATNAEALSGTNDTTAMSPLKTAQAIAAGTAGITGALVYRGSYDANTGTPALTSAVKGDFYIVSTQGSLDAVPLNIGDHIVFNQAAANPVTSAMFDVIDNTDAVSSVNGQTGVVTLSASSVGALASGDNVSELVNDSGYLTSAPVSSVNGQTGVVTLSASSVGALASGDNVSELVNDSGYLTSAPVSSVNGLTGVVTLSASSVGALASGDNVSELTNDAGYLTSAPVSSVNGQTGVVTLSASSVGALASGDNVSELVNDSGYITSNLSASITVDTDGAYDLGTESARFDKIFADLDGAVCFKASNASGAQITKGQPVYISGVSGDVPEVSLADADATAMPSAGLAGETANAGAEIRIITFGNLTDVDTSSFSLGDTLYIDTTAGALTATPPAGESAKLQNIGKVIRVHASSGIIKVGGAGRSAATPNLDQNKIFLGDVNNRAVSTALSSISVGSFNDDGTYLTSAPVTSVNALTGAVVLSANDLAADHTASNYTATNANIDGHLAGIDTALGGLGTSAASETVAGIIEIATNAEATSATATDKAIVPSNLGSVNVSTLNNDAGYITSAPVSSVNSLTGAVVLSANDLEGDYTPTNYSAAGTDNIALHLSGIDTALASAGGGSEGIKRVNTNYTVTLSDIQDNVSILYYGTATNWTVTLPDPSTLLSTAVTNNGAAGDAVDVFVARSKHGEITFSYTGIDQIDDGSTGAILTSVTTRGGEWVRSLGFLQSATNEDWVIEDTLANSFYAYRATTSAVSGTSGGFRPNFYYACSGTFTIDIRATGNYVWGDGEASIVKNNGSGTITLNGYTTYTIDGSASLALAPDEWIEIVFDSGSGDFVIFNRSLDSDKLIAKRTGTNYTASNTDSITTHLAGIDTALASAGAVSSVNTQTGAVVLSATDLEGDYTPTNYSAAGTDNIALHLSGIDTALASAGGGGGYTYSAVSTATNAVANYHYSVTGTTTVTLPAASSNANSQIRVKNMGSNTVTIAVTGGDTIDGQSSASMPTQYQSLTFMCNGSNGWEIV